ncbi:LysR family transcriptional regulator of gallate degradation [Beijerinckia sp. GAS462]|nr:LysR family transcriptional regulator of gallate degradation [Beijerinckia sp. GAS462]SEB76231.1 transcriptional regulator, LysR family [Beijerinckia sp. 28-YEA-48]
MAAEALRISQPAMTYLINQLEADLGIRLVVRGTTGTALTTIGDLFAKRTERCLQKIAEAVENLLGEGISLRRRQAVVSRIGGTQYNAILALWHEGDGASASRSLGVSQQSLLRPIRELEKLLSIKLVRSLGGRVLFTDAGRELARHLVLAGQEIGSALEEIGRGPTGARNLRIGALVLSPRLILTEALDEALRSTPRQTVEIVEGAYEDLVLRLRDGSIDVIFGALRAPPPFSDLVEAPLQKDPYIVVCRRGHPLARLKRIKAKDLEKFDFIFPTEGLRREVLDALVQRWKLSPLSQVYSNWLPTVVAMVRSSDRLAVLSRWHIESDESADLQALDTLPVPHAPRYVGLTSRASWLPTPFQQHFMDVLTKVVRARAS